MATGRTLTTYKLVYEFIYEFIYEYKLDDKALQKAQLEQHKIFQNFPINPSRLLQVILPCQQAQIPKCLETAISHTVFEKRKKKAKRQLKKLFAYENANQVCQKDIAPIHKTGTIFDYLKP